MSSDEDDVINYPTDPKGFNFHLKTDNELFDENSYIPQQLVQAKRIRLPRNGEDWQIWVNKKLVLTLKGIRFTKNERDFLKTVQGMQFLVSEYKNGNHSVAKIKNNLKKLL